MLLGRGPGLTIGARFSRSIPFTFTRPPRRRPYAARVTPEEETRLTGETETVRGRAGLCRHVARTAAMLRPDRASVYVFHGPTERGRD